MVASTGDDVRWGERCGYTVKAGVAGSNLCLEVLVAKADKRESILSI